MITKAISFLIASAFLVLPSGIAQAGDVDVQTGNMRATVVEGNTKVTNGRSQVTINRDRPNYRRNGRIYNSRLKRIPVVSPQVRRTQSNCKGSTYSHQSSQTTVSSNGNTRTQRSETTVCK